MVDLDILVRRIKMQPLCLIASPHFMTTRQLYIELHLRGTDARISIQVAQQIRASTIHNLFSSRSSRTMIPVNATTCGDAHGTTRVSTRTGRFGTLLKE
jgi:hypothetical protein